MKRLLIILLALLITGALTAQKGIDTSKYVYIKGSGVYYKRSDSSKYMAFDGKAVVDIRKATPEQLARIKDRSRMSAISDDRYYNVYVTAHTGMFPRRSLGVRFEQQTGSAIYKGNLWAWGTLYRAHILIDGKAAVEIADVLITPETAKDYRYRIIQNDNKELLGWTIPKNFKKTADGSTTYAYLGKIDYQPNQLIQVEIYNIHNYKDRDAIIIDWRPARKLNCWVIVDFKTGDFKPLNSVSLGGDKRLNWPINFIETDVLSDVKFRLGDSLVRMKFVSQNLPTAYNYQMILKRTIDGVNEKIDLGDFNKSFYLYKEFWDRPGKYELTFTPALISPGDNPVTYVRSKAFTYKFTVLPPLNPPRLFSSKELALIGVILCGIFGAILGYVITRLKKKNAGRLMKAQQQKEFAKAQLNSVRAQLNPHFMFNALAGIQNLMNKNETDTANRYLGKFARITRNVLNNKELITLAEEEALLNDYLQMEQLRFGFKYTINLSNELDGANIEIPAMLLQPFVENSIKHGISGKADGEITVNFSVSNKDLILAVTDNGMGFDAAASYPGFGLQLSQNRIALLNNIYKESKLIMVIASNRSGTTVTIRLTQWL